MRLTWRKRVDTTEFHQIKIYDMNKKFISIIMGFALFIGASLNAQKLKFGLLGGLDIVNIYMTPLEPRQIGQPYGNMRAFNINCFVSYKNKGFWGFSIEPGFIQKGGTQGAQQRDRLELNYLQIPTLAHLYIFQKLYLSIGPEFSYMISAKFISFYTDFTANIYSDYKDKIELSGLAGVNYKITQWIDLGLRYNHGISPLRKVPLYGDKFKILGQAKMYNQYYQLVVKIRI